MSPFHVNFLLKYALILIDNKIKEIPKIFFVVHKKFTITELKKQQHILKQMHCRFFISESQFSKEISAEDKAEDNCQHGNQEPDPR